MDAIMQWFSQWHVSIYIVAGVVVFILIAFGVWELWIRSRFRKIIRLSTEGKKAAAKPVSLFILKLHVRWLERLAKKKNIPIMEIFDFRHAWLDKFRSGKRRKDLLRLVDFYPDFALFPCFEVCMRHKQRGEDFKKILQALSSEEAFFLLKKLGQSCAGRDFDSAGGKALVAEHLDSFRELSGDADWTVRDFAVKILLADDDPRTLRLLWEALADSNPQIRAAAATSFRAVGEERERLFDILYKLYLDDPAVLVRRAAKLRLSGEFTDLYTLTPEALKGRNVFHVLDLLDVRSKEDENLALFYLDDAHPEIRLASALFLQKSGGLERLFLSVDFGDRENLDRTLDRLQKAASVDVTGFLAALRTTANPASLYLAGTLLRSSGERALIATLAQKTFSLVPSGTASAELLELYRTTLRCAKERGNLDAAQLVKDELQRRKKDEALRALLWEQLPIAFEPLFIPAMAQFLSEDLVAPKAAFLKGWAQFPRDISLPPLIDLLKANSSVPLSVKRNALAILGELKPTGLMQSILESLSELAPAEIPELCQMLSELDEKEFLQRAGVLVRSVDARIRSALFLGLTKAGKKEYLKDIREALGDADPDVRVSAFTALAGFDEAKVLNTNAVRLLRDPVERVRNGVALAIGTIGTDAVVEELKRLLLSKDEVASVRLASVLGLGASPLNSAIDALLEGAGVWLAVDETLKQPLSAALARKTEKKQTLYLIDKFKDGNALIRNLIASSFAYRGPEGEEILLGLLDEDIASLKPIICQVLDESGIVDILIRSLGARDPAVRMAAAEKLAKVGTAKAFRGVVQAAKDPSSEIRVLVTKALESLNTPAGNDILKELENDPDKRVRTYTAWAMERVRAKSS